MKEIKRCPYCGKEILSIAKKCRYCGKWLPENENLSSSEKNGILLMTKNNYSRNSCFLGYNCMEWIGGEPNR